MIVSWLADFTAVEHVGGAQQSNDAMIREGRRRGHKISLVTPGGLPLVEIDLFVLTHVWKWWHTYPAVVMDIIENCKYIRYEHDYPWDYMPPEWVVKMFENAALSVFQSPLHRQEFQEAGLDIEPSMCIPSPGNLEGFFNDNSVPIEDTALVVGSLSEHKGIRHVLALADGNPEIEFHFVGWVEDGQPWWRGMIEERDNCKFLGCFAHDLMPDIYREHEWLVCLPDWIEPFGLAVVEAHLCGRKVIVNDRVGCMSWHHMRLGPDEVRAWLAKSPRRFWDAIETAYSGGDPRFLRGGGLEVGTSPESDVSYGPGPVEDEPHQGLAS